MMNCILTVVLHYRVSAVPHALTSFPTSSTRRSPDLHSRHACKTIVHHDTEDQRGSPTRVRERPRQASWPVGRQPTHSMDTQSPRSSGRECQLEKELHCILLSDTALARGATKPPKTFSKPMNPAKTSGQAVLLPPSQGWRYISAMGGAVVRSLAKRGRRSLLNVSISGSCRSGRRTVDWEAERGLTWPFSMAETRRTSTARRRSWRPLAYKGEARTAHAFLPAYSPRC